MVGDQRRTGFGLPDVLRAVGLAPAHPTPLLGTAVSSQALSPQVMQVLRSLYREPPRMMPQTFGGVGTLDPYASFRQMMSPHMAMQHPYGLGLW